MGASLKTEVVIVGAGLAGAVAASVLGRRGIGVTLVDPRPEYPACFKAEKIEPEQADLFRKLGLLDVLLPHTGAIREVLEAKGGRVLRVARLEQYGIYYHDMVNAIRRALPASVDVRTTRVDDIEPSDDLQRVKLGDGTEVVGRVVLLASGTGGALSGRLGLSRRVIRKEHSVAFGFDIARPDRSPFPFQSITYYPDGCHTRIGYLTLFIIRDVMRANMFTFHSLRDEWSRACVRDAKRAVLDSLPGLGRLVGDFEVTSEVESARIDLYQLENPPMAGLVPLADAYQSVCPTTGTGLTKVLTDVDVLCTYCLPGWLATPGMSAQKTSRFHRHWRKQAEDRQSLSKAEYRRQVSTDGSLRWRVHRGRLYFDSLVAGWPEAFTLTKKLTA